MGRKTKPAKPELVVQELTYENDDAAPVARFVIKNVASGEWWLPNERGYTAHLLRAGTYEERHAREIEKRTGADVAVPLGEALTELTPVNREVVAALVLKVARPG